MALNVAHLTKFVTETNVVLALETHLVVVEVVVIIQTKFVLMELVFVHSLNAVLLVALAINFVEVEQMELASISILVQYVNVVDRSAVVQMKCATKTHLLAVLHHRLAAIMFTILSLKLNGTKLALERQVQQDVLGTRNFPVASQMEFKWVVLLDFLQDSMQLSQTAHQLLISFLNLESLIMHLTNLGSIHLKVFRLLIPLQVHSVEMF